MFIQWTFTFLGGFVIAFVYEWRLSLVILATTPLLVIAGYSFSVVSGFEFLENDMMQNMHHCNCSPFCILTNNNNLLMTPGHG